MNDYQELINKGVQNPQRRWFLKLTALGVATTALSTIAAKELGNLFKDESNWPDNKVFQKYSELQQDTLDTPKKVMDKINELIQLATNESLPPHIENLIVTIGTNFSTSVFSKDSTRTNSLTSSEQLNGSLPLTQDRLKNLTKHYGTINYILISVEDNRTAKSTPQEAGSTQSILSLGPSLLNQAANLRTSHRSLVYFSFANDDDLHKELLSTSPGTIIRADVDYFSTSIHKNDESILKMQVNNRTIISIFPPKKDPIFKIYYDNLGKPQGAAKTAYIEGRRHFDKFAHNSSGKDN